jgi:hypothetical protein
MFLIAGGPSLGPMISIPSFVKGAGVAVVVAGLMGSGLFTAEAGESTTEAVVGGWVGELPCPFTSAGPSAGRPTTILFECVSGTTWDGDWLGHTAYRAAGTLDVVSGDFHATLDETLTGLVSATRAGGTLHLLGTVDVVGATGALVVRERSPARIPSPTTCRHRCRASSGGWLSGGNSVHSSPSTGS